MSYKKIVYTTFQLGLCCIFFFAAQRLAAQNTTTLQAMLRDAGGKAIEQATVLLNNTLHGVSDKRGQISFRNVRPGEYAYTASCVGYNEAQGRLVVKGDGKDTLQIVLWPLTLQLAEVTVTAQQQAMGARSIIGQEAIRHLQPKSVADLLQLLPGALTVDPTLNTIAQASLRDTEENMNNAMGTAIIIDGAPVSNDANLQALSTAKAGAKSSNNADGMDRQTTASKGVDLRTISADNIERVEVIRGIPGVEYGNLTSGVVLIKTKKGETPFEAKLKADAFSKLVYVGKGFNRGEHTTFNIGVDYSQSYQDTRRRYRGFDRITGSFGWGTVWAPKGKHPVTFNVNGSFYSNINNYKSDPQLQAMGLSYRNENVGGRLSVNGDMKFNGLITALNYDFSAQLARMLDTHHSYVANPDGVVSNSMVDGESVARFLTQTYYSDYFIEGIPYHLYARIKVNRYWQLKGASYTDLKLGAEYKVDGNKGRGLVFDMTNPPQSMSAQTLRPRSYKDIPALGSLSFFAENNASFRIGAQRLQVMAGVRMSTLLLSESKARRSSITVIEPRLNLEYTFLSSQNNSWFDKFSLTAGFGLANKMPPLLYLYPDKAYFDSQSLSYRGGLSEKESLAVMTTRVISDTQNAQLRPIHSTKFEVGLNARVGRVNGYVTFFREANRNELGFDGVPEFLSYRIYNVPPGVSALTYQPGTIEYTLGGNKYTADTSTGRDIVTWNRPANNSRSDKWGIEYAVNFGTYRPLSTSLNIDGAWFHIKRKNTTTSLQYINKLYDYIGVLPAGDGTVNDRINTNFRFITHLSALKMVFTTTMQVVWYEQIRSLYEREDGSPAYHFSADGTEYQVSPLGYYDRSGVYQAWTAAAESDAKLKLLTARYMLYAFKADRVNPWVLFNFRLTKELGKIAEISFMANNFLNTSRFHINRHTQGRRQLYPDLYFGAEVKLKL